MRQDLNRKNAVITAILMCRGPKSGLIFHLRAIKMETGRRHPAGGGAKEMAGKECDRISTTGRQIAGSFIQA